MRHPSLTLRSIRARPVVLKLKRPVVARIATITDWPLILIDLETEEGVVGRAYLEPYVAKAMARKQAMKPMRDEDIPVYVALGRKVAEEGTGTERQKQNARLWADAAKVILSDPGRHGSKTSATS